MAKLTKLSVEARNVGLDAELALLNNGYIKIYDGSRPASVDMPVSSQTLLAQPRWASTAFQPSDNGSAEANAITPDPSAAANGTPTWARFTKEDGTGVFDVNVGTSNVDLVLSAASVVMGAEVGIVEYIFTMPESI